MITILSDKISKDVKIKKSYNLLKEMTNILDTNFLETLRVIWWKKQRSDKINFI